MFYKPVFISLPAYYISNEFVWLMKEKKNLHWVLQNMAFYFSIHMIFLHYSFLNQVLSLVPYICKVCFQHFSTWNFTSATPRMCKLWSLLRTESFASQYYFIVHLSFGRSGSTQTFCYMHCLFKLIDCLVICVACLNLLF